MMRVSHYLTLPKLAVIFIFPQKYLDHEYFFFPPMGGITYLLLFTLLFDAVLVSLVKLSFRWNYVDP